jgi:hypothetical protein
MNNDDLVTLEQQTTRTSMEDGLTYFPFSLMLLITAFIVQMPYLLAIIPILIIYGPKAIERLREKYTYPRIGYVKLRDGSSREVGKGFIGFLAIVFLVPISIVAFLLGGNVTIAMLFRWLPFAFGVVMIGPSMFIVEVTGSRIYYLLGISTSITGYGISYLVDQGLLGLMIFMLLWGILISLAGLVIFIRFIRKYPILETEGIERVE